MNVASSWRKWVYSKCSKSIGNSTHSILLFRCKDDITKRIHFEMFGMDCSGKVVHLPLLQDKIQNSSSEPLHCSSKRFLCTSIQNFASWCFWEDFTSCFQIHERDWNEFMCKTRTYVAVLTEDQTCPILICVVSCRSKTSFRVLSFFPIRWLKGKGT